MNKAAAGSSPELYCSLLTNLFTAQSLGKKLALYISANQVYVTYVCFKHIISAFLYWHRIWADLVIRRWRGWWMACHLSVMPAKLPTAAQHSLRSTNNKAVNHCCFQQLFRHQTWVIFSDRGCFSTGNSAKKSGCFFPRHRSFSSRNCAPKSGIWNQP